MSRVMCEGGREEGSIVLGATCGNSPLQPPLSFDIFVTALIASKVKISHPGGAPLLKFPGLCGCLCPRSSVSQEKGASIQFYVPSHGLSQVYHEKKMDK